MKCLQVLGSVIFVASSASTVYGGAIDTTTHGTSYGLAAPAMVSYGISHAAPATVSYGAAPAVSVAAAPVAHASARSIRSHEIHTGGSANQIRVEEYKAGGQLIRVHDAPQTDPEVINVQGPAAAGNHIRVVSHNGPTQIQRAVFQDPNTQVFDVVNPPKPADRVINIRGSPAPPARVELVAEHQYAAPEVTVGGDEPQVQVVQAGVAASSKNG
ncbi:hypothetical protein BIW11_01514 [Tropilaelaps mercedesae]|uniref:Uncharacterized protein n=1 Tax=Tropilaelaps mercedesae TaxID=418985 RepID=A0A1V9XCU2_9ACAR|nr:hypothetical protein BIW11_01514 [Tropilaelaps mercedesae]